nr:MAG TPA: transmembrane protein [Caudoviricetes sp.]
MTMLNALLIIFVIAKILGFITWSWWIVLSPLLIQVSIGLLSLVFYGVANFRIMSLLKKLKKEL